MPKLTRLSRKYTALGDIGRSGLKRINPLKGHPFVIPVIAFFAVVFISLVGIVLSNTTTVGASDSHIVQLFVDGQERTVPTRAKTVADLLNRLQIKVTKDDIVDPDVSTPILEDNTEVKVQIARPVTVIDSGRATTILTAHQQPRKIVESAGITLYPEDGIDTKPQPVENTQQKILGEQIVVDRAKPANINLYGNSIPVRTRAKTVGELLDDKDVKTIAGDTVQPDRDTPITDNIQVFVLRNGQQVQTVSEVIPFVTLTQDDPTLTVGVTQVRTPGVNGTQLVTYQINTVNGQETSRSILQQVVSVEPVRQVVARGTKPLITGGPAQWLVAAGVPQSDYYAADYIIGHESGWCPTKWQGQSGSCPAYHGAPSSSGIGYGLCQATPGYKMSSAGSDWAVNPVTQLKWCTSYAAKYGGWKGAYNFWLVNHWW